jgi:hypothetical protein
MIVIQLRRRAKRFSGGFVHVKRASSVASRGFVHTLLATLGVGRDVHCRSKGGVMPNCLLLQRLVAAFPAKMRAGQRRGLGCQGTHHTRLCFALPPLPLRHWGDLTSNTLSLSLRLD